MLRTTEIEMQDYSNACADVAIVNLFKLRGLTPPSREDISNQLTQLFSGPRIGDQQAPKAIEVLNLLISHGFFCALVGVPPSFWSAPQKILTRFLDAGCNLLLYFNWRMPEGPVSTHVTLAEGYTERGYRVIDGEPGGHRPEGSTIELEPNMPSEAELEQARQWMQTHSHGNRLMLPFINIAVSHSPQELALGLLPHFIVVYPSPE